MGKKIVVHIEGYGKIKLKRPRKLTKKSYSNGVAEAVAKTMQLVVGSPDTYFHPALGCVEKYNDA